MEEYQKQINKYLEDHYEEALEFLEKLVQIDSYSHDKEGVNKVSSLIREKLKEEGVPYEVIENERYGNHLIAKLKGNLRGNLNRKVLLIGHKDTAHPTGTLKEFPFANNGTHLTGPGVSDMKSGLVYMIYTLLAFKATNFDKLFDIELLFTPDEEIGSPISRKIIEEIAEDASVAFVLEPSRPDGSIVSARKGSAHLKIEVIGKAAHSGAFIEDGISANDELAQKMIQIKKLADEEKDLTINFGVIEGGISNNIVAPHATATIHCAFWKEKDFYDAYEKIQEIVNQSFIPGTKSKLSGSIGMLPMENNEKNTELYKHVVMKAANDLQLENIVSLPTKGASEAGFTSSKGVPTICGMGPIGGKWHTKGEYMELNSFLPRMKLLGTSMLYAMNYYGQT